MTTSIIIAGVPLTKAAAENLQAVAATKAAQAAEVAQDVSALRRGEKTPAQLLAYCLDGAEPEYVQGWRDYVSAIEAAAKR